MYFIALLGVVLAIGFAFGWVSSYHRTMRIMKKCVMPHSTVHYLGMTSETVIR